MLVVRPVLVSTVTVPPFCPPSIVTGPWRVGSWASLLFPSVFLSTPPPPPLPPPLSLLPPQAASARRAAVLRATIGFLNRIAGPPFFPCVVLRPAMTSVNGEFWGRRRLGSSRPGG